MVNLPIKVGFCVAYDWYLLEKSLPLVYDMADEIFLSVDESLVSWSGSAFVFDDKGFNDLVSKIDAQKKIRIYRDDFHKADLSPMENEVRQRNMMAFFMGKGGWHIQLDADEYFLDFAKFVNNLRAYKGGEKVNICVPFITLFKKLEDSWLLISADKKELTEYIPVATLCPHYEYGRNNGYFNYRTNDIVLHQSWARPNAEIEMKVANWGHKHDFDIKAFLEFWKALSPENYLAARDFHPIKPHLWQSLQRIPGNHLEEVIYFLKQHPPALLSDRELKKNNSINRSRINSILRKAGLIK